MGDETRDMVGTTEPQWGNASFNVQIDGEMDRRLRELSRARRVPKSIIVRTCLRAYLAMELDQRPMCGNGQMCLCPQMWERIGRGVGGGDAA